MRRFAVRSLWRDGCLTVLIALSAGRVLAGTPPNVVITTPAEAEAFAESGHFVFRGQQLRVHTSFSTDAEIQLDGAAPILVGEGTRFELRGPIASDGPLGMAKLTKTGLGTLALYGHNTYMTDTHFHEGTLEVGGTSALGEEIQNVVQHAGTALHLADGAEVSNMIRVHPALSGHTALPGLEGRVEWRVDSGEARIALRPQVDSGVPVRKTGGGTLHIMRGLGNHAPFHVDEGVLRADGFISAYIDVAAHARLEGTGEVFDLRIRDGGMVAPAGMDAPGTLSVLTDLRFDPGGRYHVNAYPDGQSDLLRAGGLAWLDGEVQVMAGPGEWAPEKDYTILWAVGGLNDSRFAEATTDLAFLDPELSYDANRVYLTLRRNDLDIGDVGETPDDRDVGDVIDPPGTPDTPDPDDPPAPTPDEPAPEDPKPGDPAPEEPTQGEPTPENPGPDRPTPRIPRRKTLNPKAPQQGDPTRGPDTRGSGS